MKKSTLTLVLILSFIWNLYSQVTDKKKDIVVYKNLVEELGIRKGVAVFYHTSTYTLKKVDFKNTDFSTWWGEYQNIEKLKSAFGNINIKKIKDYTIMDSISQHPLVEQLQPIQKPLYTLNSFIMLSPVIYSKDNELAMCSLYEYDGPQSAAETIYVFEFRKGKWKIVKFFPVSIS